jgi:hypothetical protein
MQFFPFVLEKQAAQHSAALSNMCHEAVRKRSNPAASGAALVKPVWAPQKQHAGVWITATTLLLPVEFARVLTLSLCHN